MKKEVRNLIADLNKVLPAPWRARESLFGYSVDVFHPGEAGGGVRIQGREVIVIEPTLLPDGQLRGPVGHRRSLGHFKGRAWRLRLFEQVWYGITLFKSLYGYAMPVKEGDK